MHAESKGVRWSRALRRGAGALTVLALSWGAAAAMASLGGGPVAPPLERPAITWRDPAHAALMGLAQAGQRLVAVGERGLVLLSDDQGQHWRQAAEVPVSVSLTAVQFVDAQNGWAVGHQGVVLASTDGGEHWQRQLDGHRAAQLQLEEAQAVGDARVLQEAQRAVQEGADKPLLALSFANAKEGMVIGAFNLALVTRDGGRHWASVSATLPNPKAVHLYSVARSGDDLLIAGEQGLVLHSADGGAHFRAVPTPYEGSFFGAMLPAQGHWLVAGLRGNVLRSDDQGAHWQALRNPVAASITASTVGQGGEVLLLNQGGDLLTPDARGGGDNVQVLAHTPSQQAASLLQLADGSLVMAGWNGISRQPAPRVSPHPPTNALPNASLNESH
jgi:photosystem II stability/assembly factor-like uncharacterized protein